MAFKNIVILLVLSTLLAVAVSQIQQGGSHTSQGGPHQNQGRARRQVSLGGSQIDQGEPGEDQQGQANGQSSTVWTTCDYTVTPKLSCQDCSTRLICKPQGGIIKVCRGSRPYCNNGICSSVPSADCA